MVDRIARTLLKRDGSVHINRLTRERHELLTVHGGGAASRYRDVGEDTSAAVLALVVNAGRESLSAVPTRESSVRGHGRLIAGSHNAKRETVTKSSPPLGATNAGLGR